MSRFDFDLEIRTRQEAIHELNDRIRFGGYLMVDGRRTGERVRLSLDAASRAAKTISNLEEQISNIRLRKDARDALESRSVRRESRDRFTDAVHSLLKDGQRTTREIAETLDLTMDQARRTCKRLERKGVIRVASSEHSGSVRVVRWSA